MVIKMKNNVKSFFESGTQSFEYILNELKFKENSEIIVPVTLCYSIIEVIIKKGFKPIFADINDCFLIDNVNKYITKKTRMIVFVEQYGFKITDNSLYLNKNNEKIIKVLDSCQGYINTSNEFDYIFYSFNKNKPIELGHYAMVLSDHKIKDSLKISKKDLTKIYIKKKSFTFKYIRRLIIKKLIKTNLKIPCYFINYKNKTFHRIIVILNISKKDFVNFDNLLYEYIEMNNLNIVQTTIEKAPYEVLNINQKFKNYNNLKYKTLYFRPNFKIKEYIKVIKYINEVYNEKVC